MPLLLKKMVSKLDKIVRDCIRQVSIEKSSVDGVSRRRTYQANP